MLIEPVLYVLAVLNTFATFGGKIEFLADEISVDQG